MTIASSESEGIPHNAKPAVPGVPIDGQTGETIDRINTLSARQKEVFYWICEGKRDREIAIILGISYQTVSVHVHAILKKLGAENRTCAAMMAARVDQALSPTKSQHP